MQRSRILLLATALTVLGAGAACGGGDKDNDNAAPAQKVSDVKNDGAAGGASGSTVTLTAKEFSFDQKDVKLVAGQATTIVLKNGGAIEHDITIDNPAFALKALPTKTEQKQITIPAAGTYTFYCSVPGHRQGGMEGTVTVS
jgi:cytochrome c oxidase subunit 2